VQLWICGPAGYASWDAPFTAHLTRTSKHTVGYIGQLVVVALCKASVLILASIRSHRDTRRCPANALE
jgi:hypothetical protein